MPEPDWALERAREIMRRVKESDWQNYEAEPAEWIAAELRKERDRADDTESDLPIWKDAARKQQRLREAAEAKAAALEAALEDVIDLRSAGACLGCDSTQQAARDALRDHSGALAEHDREVRRKTLLEAAGYADRSKAEADAMRDAVATAAWSCTAMWLRELAEESE